MSIPQELILREAIREQLLRNPKYKSLKENSLIIENIINEGLFGMTWTDLGIMTGQLVGTGITAAFGWTGVGAAVGMTINAASTLYGVYHYMSQDEPDIISAAFTVIGGFTGGAGGVALKGAKVALYPFFKVFGTQGLKIGAGKYGLGPLYRALKPHITSTGGRWLINAIESLQSALKKVGSLFMAPFKAAQGWIDKINRTGGTGIAAPIKRVIAKAGGWFTNLFRGFRNFIEEMTTLAPTWSAEARQLKTAYSTWKFSGRPVSIANRAGEVALKTGGKAITGTSFKIVGKSIEGRPVAEMLIPKSILDDIPTGQAISLDKIPGPSLISRILRRKPSRIRFDASDINLGDQRFRIPEPTGRAWTAGTRNVISPVTVGDNVKVFMEVPLMKPNASAWRPFIGAVGGAHARYVTDTGSDTMTEAQLDEFLMMGNSFEIPEDDIFTIDSPGSGDSTIDDIMIQEPDQSDDSAIEDQGMQTDDEEVEPTELKQPSLGSGSDSEASAAFSRVFGGSL